MAYIYLFNLYDKIDLDLKEAKKIIAQAGPRSEQSIYQQGRVDAFEAFKQYLEENMNHKLPKRMRKKLDGRS